MAKFDFCPLLFHVIVITYEKTFMYIALVKSLNSHKDYYLWRDSVYLIMFQAMQWEVYVRDLGVSL